MTSELKPCSSCVGEAKLIKRSFYAGKESRLKSYRERVECKVCGLTTREYNKPNAAVHSWNTRATPSADTLAGLVRYGISMFGNGAVEMGEGEYVLYSEAAKIVAMQAAKEADIERLTCPTYLEEKLIQVGVCDIEWQKRAQAAEAELAQIKAQDPVAWMHPTAGWTDVSKSKIAAHCKHGTDPKPLYAAPVDQTAEIERYREALEFYADIRKYPAPLTGGMGDLWSDCGEVARAALSGKEPS
ncbi:hypothetical protein FHS77_002681 [Paenochrobactrum gallinarii]|uniref:Uncharacterized protein n=1 Tax=Paenochrobactrum gallinarii TaxID=643673 RepID=A0A841LVC5_9HYPH|nr:Lar family restriction alleviation protein [Paenochrobactrum gallinarii]MBB6262113.1 hypothetical protein [Paenochrobactrum gallinarii]